MMTVLAFGAAFACVIALGASAPIPARRPPAHANQASRHPRRAPAWWVPLVGPWLHGRRDQRRDAALPQWLALLAASLRAGHPLASAILSTAPDAPEALRPELSRVAEAIRHGASASDALETWRREQPSSAVGLTASSLGLAVRTGGSVAQSVDRVAATLRERLEAQAEFRAMGAQARASAWVLIAAPPGFTLLVATADRSLARFLLTTPVGLSCLGLGLLLDAVGAAWMTRITRGRP